MATLKPGLRLKSAVCTGEATIIKATDTALTCGGIPMYSEGEAPAEGLEANPEHMFKCLMGKRYVSEDDELEVLCIKPGEGSFGANGNMLLGKETKKLPSSD